MPAGRCDRSVGELTADLPYLGVAQGEAKIRQILRHAGPFTEVWRGRVASRARRPSAAALPHHATARVGVNPPPGAAALHGNVTTGAAGVAV